MLPSLAAYLVGLIFYIFHVPECLITAEWTKYTDWFGGGSHAIWHLFIVFGTQFLLYPWRPFMTLSVLQGSSSTEMPWYSSEEESVARCALSTWTAVDSSSPLTNHLAGWSFEGSPNLQFGIA